MEKRPEVLQLGAVVLAPGGELEGTVRDGSGAPIPGAEVPLRLGSEWSDEPTGAWVPERDEAGARLARDATTDADGAYSLRGVPAGEAFLVARAAEASPACARPRAWPHRRASG